MKKLVVFIVAMFVAGVSANAVANSGPTEVTFDTKPGSVTYKHTEHTKRGAECQSCHHQGVLSGTCRRCHDGTGDAPTFKQAAHKLCKGCHKASGGPTKCSGCHIK